MATRHEQVAHSSRARRGRWAIVALATQSILLAWILSTSAGGPAAAVVAASIGLGLAACVMQAGSPRRATDDLRGERTRILHEIASGSTLVTALDSIASFASSHCAGPCAILLLEDSSDQPRLRALVAHGIDLATAERAGRCLGVALSGAGDAVPRIACDEGDASVPACSALGFLDSRGQPAGCIAVFGPAAPRLGHAGSQALATAADLVSIAMSRTQADASMQSLVEDLETRNAELERTRAEADAARARAEAAASVKGEFLANMSHELRTPMTAILGFADVLAHPDVGVEERTEHVGSIRRAGEHLLALINDVLDLSKIEAGKMVIEQVELSPLQVMGDAVGMLREKARAKGVHLAMRCDGAVPTRIRSDPTRIRQILINLVGNAVKFTERGEVSVRIGMRTPPGDPDPVLLLEVSDTGIGIPADALPRLFTPFTQSDGSMTRRYGGTGLGLAICRRLSELLGGSISVESSPGKGSSFRVAVPTGPLDGVPMISGLDALAARQAAEQMGGTHLQGRILVADDSIDNQRLLAFHLRRAGAEVDIAANGREAVRKALESLADRRGAFDLILMDLQMPELDGYQATSVLRSRGWDRPIVALTANGAQNERDRGLASGCDDFESKPIARDDLLEVCRRWLERSRSSHDARRAA